MTTRIGLCQPLPGAAFCADLADGLVDYVLDGVGVGVHIVRPVSFETLRLQRMACSSILHLRA